MVVKALRKELTELESCVLGAVWLRGPCTAYAIRCEFAESTSSYWSASSGSIYPVIKRLRALGLVSAAADPSDKRDKRVLVATARGSSILRSWVRDLPAWTGKPSLDPIRSRLNFIAVLEDRAAQLDFVERAHAAARAQVHEFRRQLPTLKKTSAVEYLTNLGGLEEVEARAHWLGAVRKMLADGPILK